MIYGQKIEIITHGDEKLKKPIKEFKAKFLNYIFAKFYLNLNQKQGVKAKMLNPENTEKILLYLIPT